MNEADLSARIATETSLSRAGANDAVFSTIDDALASSETDRIASFGTFSMRSRSARQPGNPRARARSSPSTPRRRLPCPRQFATARTPMNTAWPRDEFATMATRRPSENARPWTVTFVHADK